jgi:hypothetical protein
MRAAVAILLGLMMCSSLTCDETEFSTLVLTGQVAKTLNPESNTATILLGKATVQNILHDDWMETPDPGDTNFGVGMFPAMVTPVSGATVTLNGGAVGERISGLYFKPGAGLQYLARYDLDVMTADGKHITAHGFLPDSFDLVTPHEGDSFGLEQIDVAWTASESAETYIVGCDPVDTASTAQGWSDSRTDTSCQIPVSAFKDSLGVFVPGDYVVGVTAVNGGWKKSGLDLFLSGGNVSGAVGVFGCAVYPQPAVIIVR